jgi:hypothetical protein
MRFLFFRAIALSFLLLGFSHSSLASPRACLAGIFGKPESPSVQKMGPFPDVVVSTLVESEFKPGEIVN